MRYPPLLPPPSPSCPPAPTPSDIHRHRRLDKEAEKLTRRAEADAFEWGFNTSAPSSPDGHGNSFSSPRRDHAVGDHRLSPASPAAAAAAFGARVTATAASACGEHRGRRYSRARGVMDALPEELELRDRMGVGSSSGGDGGGSSSATPTSVSSPSVAGRDRTGEGEHSSGGGGGGGWGGRGECFLCCKRL